MLITNIALVFVTLLLTFVTLNHTVKALRSSERSNVIEALSNLLGIVQFFKDANSEEISQGAKERLLVAKKRIDLILSGKGDEKVRNELFKDLFGTSKEISTISIELTKSKESIQKTNQLVERLKDFEWFYNQQECSYIDEIKSVIGLSSK